MRWITETIANLVLHGNTPLPQALATPETAAREFFESGPYDAYRKRVEWQQKVVTAHMSRLDGLRQALGGLGKLLAAMQKGMGRLR